MTSTYLNATWALNGQAYDFCLSDTEAAPLSADGIPLPGVRDMQPAGSAAAEHAADATGKVLMPALFDLHTHLEIPGRSKRECIMRAGEAAIRGGVWGMLVLPDAMFCFDNAAALDSFREATSASAAEMVPACCISQGMKGEQQAPYNTLSTTRGVMLLSDGQNYPSNTLMLYRAMQYAGELGLTFAVRGDVPALSEHTYAHPGTTAYRLGLRPCPPCAEEIGLETLIRMAEDTGARLHLQLVSTAEGVRIIRRAKERGKAKLTAEVALHHLLYTHENIGDYNTVFKTTPPLRDKADCEALLEGVKDGTIDCIVSAHTPCTPFAKKQDFITAPQGMVGLDTFLPAIYTYLVKPGLLTWQEVVRACCVNPARIANPQDIEEGMPLTAPLLLFDPAVTTTVSEETLTCGTLNTPLLGETLHGGITLPLR